jgi:hypothetical protein
MRQATEALPALPPPSSLLPLLSTFASQTLIAPLAALKHSAFAGTQCLS